MPIRPTRPRKKVTSSTTKEYIGRHSQGKGLVKSKVLRVSQVVEHEQQLIEKKKKDELREFQSLHYLE
jgi:hypothetical protein